MTALTLTGTRGIPRVNVVNIPLLVGLIQERGDKPLVPTLLNSLKSIRYRDIVTKVYFIFHKSSSKRAMR